MKKVTEGLGDIAIGGVGVYAGGVANTMLEKNVEQINQPWMAPAATAAIGAVGYVMSPNKMMKNFFFGMGAGSLGELGQDYIPIEGLANIRQRRPVGN